MAITDYNAWSNSVIRIWHNIADDGSKTLKCHWFQGARAQMTFDALWLFGNEEQPKVGQIVNIDGNKAIIVHVMYGYELAFLERVDNA